METKGAKVSADIFFSKQLLMQRSQIGPTSIVITLWKDREERPWLVC